LLRYHPLEGRFGKNRVKQQKQAKSIGAEESNNKEAMMRVELRVRNTDLVDAIRRYIEERLNFELSRFKDQVGRVRVKISGLNGPRGGTKKSCRISADFNPIGRVAVREIDLDLYAAIDRAAGRVSRLLGLRLEKVQETNFKSETVLAA
jgi:putative sigma-54 modulation protein